MLIAVVLSFTILIFPIFLNLKIVYNKEIKKIFYIVKIFGKIKVISGYASFFNNGIALHISDKKAILVEVIDYKGLKKSFKPFMDYHFITFKSKIELGKKEDLLLPLANAFVFNYIQSIIKWYFLNKKPYLVYENNFSVYEKEDKFCIFIKTLVVFNLLMVLISTIKIVLEKFVYEFRKS